MSTERVAPAGRAAGRRGVVDVGPRLPAVVPREVVDHALARRALLRALHHRGGQLATAGTSDVCDASSELLRAADEAGVPSAADCPVCSAPALHSVSWVFGESLGALSGTPRAPRQLAALAVRRPEFDVFEVEVCAACRWNCLLRSYRAGRVTAD
ncbi:MAG: DUF5318 family protein [Actinomycetes bacterium]